MADFTVRSDSLNVEQIMEQIRARIREKRGVDYTEQQIHELAKVKLEKFLDPRSVRSDLLDQYRKLQPAYEPPELPNYAFEDSTLFESHRAPLRFIRRLLRPILKLFFNPNPLIQALHIQSRLNTMYAQREAKREALRVAGEQLYYELLHNLVVEMTRTGIEVKNLKMRVESLSSRLEFNERRARALESAVVYKPSTDDRGRVSTPVPDEGPPIPVPTQGQPIPVPGPGQRSRRRRRRRGRRGGAPAVSTLGTTPPPANAIATEDLQTFSGAVAHPSEGGRDSVDEPRSTSTDPRPQPDASDPGPQSGDTDPRPRDPDDSQ